MTHREPPHGSASRGRWAALPIVILLGACVEITTPPGRATAYFGNWAGPDVTLSVTSSRVVYRKTGGVFDWAALDVPFGGLSGNDIIYGRKNSRLRVDVPPHRIGKVWKMTVEGRELQRR
jgi:hypothetical protein